MIHLLGYAGFVGSGIANYLTKKGVDFKGIDRKNYDAYMNTSCDLFINAGGNSKKRLAAQDPKTDLEKNVLETFKTLFDFKFNKYIYLSTIDVYNDVSNPEKNHEDALIKPEELSNYGFNKYLGEQIVKKYAKNWLILRLGGMVGPNLKKNAVFDLMNQGIVYVHPESEYQYMHTEDVAESILKLQEFNRETFNVCGDGVITPEEIAEHLGIKLKKEFYELKYEKYMINIEKIKKITAIKKTKETVFEFIYK